MGISLWFVPTVLQSTQLSKLEKSFKPWAPPFPNVGHSNLHQEASFDLNNSNSSVTPGLFKRLFVYLFFILCRHIPPICPLRVGSVLWLYKEKQSVSTHQFSKDHSFSRLRARCLICFPSRAVYTEQVINARPVCF